jgi:ADP-ribose pyrophosphatase YjhB (NUDIX family)
VRNIFMHYFEKPPDNLVECATHSDPNVRSNQIEKSYVFVVNQRREVLVAHLHNTSFKSWTVPFDVRDIGERPSQTCLRSLFEATGLRADEGDLICLGTSQKRSRLIQAFYLPFERTSGTINGPHTFNARLNGQIVDGLRWVSVSRTSTILRNLKIGSFLRPWTQK